MYTVDKMEVLELVSLYRMLKHALLSISAVDVLKNVLKAFQKLFPMIWKITIIAHREMNSNASNILTEKCAQSYSTVICRIKTYLFQSHVVHFLHHYSRLQPGSYESWENLQ